MQRGKLIVLFALVAVFSFTGVSFSVWNTPVRLTDNSINDGWAEVSGNNVVWQAGPFLQEEIIFYNGSVTTTLTSNSWPDWIPRIDGNRVVWNSQVNNADWEILSFNGSVTTTLTANDLSDTDPHLSGNNTVWSRHDGNDSEIIRHDGLTETSVTDNNIEDDAPAISGNNIAWRAFDGDYEIMFFNGTNTTTLTANTVIDDIPQISGGSVVWERWDGNDFEIMLYKDSTETTLTNNDIDDRSPVISGANVAWQRHLPGNVEIMLYNGSTPATISISPYNDQSPAISGNKVVWFTSGGPTQDVHVFDGAGTHLISTPNFGQSPKISGNRVAWDTFGGGDNEVYTYKFDYANPGDPGVTSAVPPKDIWTTDNTILVNFSGGADSISGVDGYSVSWSGAPLTLPDAVKDLEESAGSALSPAQPDGNRWFHLSTRDNAGNWTSTVHYGPFKIDRTKPIASMKAPASMSAAGLTARFRVSWKGWDSGSGVKNYDVAYRIGKRGVWKRWKTGVTGVRARFTADTGKTYYFRARAKDKVGNIGAWSRVRRTVVGAL